MPRIQRVAAHPGHAALHALTAPAIAVGCAETNFGGRAVQWSGVEMPSVFPGTGESLQAWAATLRGWPVYTMPGVAAGHVGAAFKRRWIDGHDVFRRMTVGGR